MKSTLSGISISIGLLAAAPAFAQSQAERIAKLMSREFAMQSLGALLTGQRRSAISFALRGLPADLAENEVADYAEAMFALELSVGSRMPILDVRGEGIFSVDSTGTRALAGFYDARPEVNEKYFPLALYDAESGSLIAKLDPQVETHVSVSPSFSSDGQFLAVPSRLTTSVQIFRAEDGSHVGEMAADESSDAQATSCLPLGFSADGAHYACGFVVGGSGGVRVWKVEDLSLAYHLELPGEPNIGVVPQAWDHLGGIVVMKTTQPDPTQPPEKVELERWSLDGEVKSIGDITGVIGGDTSGGDTFGDVPLILMEDQARLAAIDLDTGKVRFTTEVLDAEVALVRDGTAFSIRPFDIGSLEDFQVLDLSGKRLETRARDLIPLAQLAISTSGEIAGMPRRATEYTYHGDDLPEGAALYDHVWASLSDAERAEIDRDRVPRP